MPLPTSRSMRMMTSVSILVRMIGAEIALSFVKGFGISALHRSHVGDGAGDRGSRGTCRAGQMGTRARALAADKIAVGGRDRALPGSHHFAIGGQTHRTAGLAPLEARLGEQFVEPFGDRIALDGFRTRHHPGPDAGRNFSPACNFGGGAQIAEPAVGAGADEDPIDRSARNRRAGFEAHVVERGFQRGTPRWKPRSTTW